MHGARIADIPRLICGALAFDCLESPLDAGVIDNGVGGQFDAGTLAVLAQHYADDP